MNLAEILNNANLSSNSGNSGKIWDYSKFWNNFPNLKKEFPQVKDFLECKSFEGVKKTHRKLLQRAKADLLTAYRKSGKKDAKILQSLKDLHKNYCLDSLSFDDFIKSKE